MLGLVWKPILDLGFLLSWHGASFLLPGGSEGWEGEERNTVWMCQSLALYIHACSVANDSVTPWSVAHQIPLYLWNFPGKITGVSCHFLLRGIFPTQESKPSLLHLLHWQVDSLPTVPPRCIGWWANRYKSPGKWGGLHWRQKSIYGRRSYPGKARVEFLVSQEQVRQWSEGPKGQTWDTVPGPWVSLSDFPPVTSWTVFPSNSSVKF